MWAKTGSRPAAVRQTRYEWVYLYAAVEPATGESVAPPAPDANTGTMNVFPGLLSKELRPGEHAVLIPGGAEWHRNKALVVPDNVTCLLPPAYSPELNPAENLTSASSVEPWDYLRSQHWSNQAYRDYDHLLGAGREAWR